MNGSALAVRQQSTEIQAAQEWSDGQIQALRDTVAKDLSQPEFQLFGYVCQRTGLDPFRKQIYAIKRGGKVTFQTGIDGFRAIAVRSGEYEGQTPPQWCGDDGVWRDVWLAKDPPAAARIGVYRAKCREPIWGVARTAAYREDSNNLWKKMPDVMIAKCAEALALRKAFPEDMSGVYSHEEMDQAEDEPGPRHRPPSTPPPPVMSNAEREKLVAQLRARIQDCTTEETLKLAGGDCTKAHREGRINDVDRQELAVVFAKNKNRILRARTAPPPREPGDDSEEDGPPDQEAGAPFTATKDDDDGGPG